MIPNMNKNPYTRIVISKDRKWIVLPTFIIHDRIHGIGYSAKHPAGHRSDWAVDNFEEINWDRLRKI